MESLAYKKNEMALPIPTNRIYEIRLLGLEGSSGPYYRSYQQFQLVNFL